MDYLTMWLSAGNKDQEPGVEYVVGKCLVSGKQSRKGKP